MLELVCDNCFSHGPLGKSQDRARLAGEALGWRRLRHPKFGEFIDICPKCVCIHGNPVLACPICDTISSRLPRMKDDGLS